MNTFANNTMSPASAPALLRSVSGDESELPPLMIVVQPSIKQTRTMRSLPDRVQNHSYTSCPAGPSASSSFGPEAVESTADLISMYRQVWQNQVSPLSTDMSTKRQQSDYCFDNDEEEDDDDDMSVFSLASSFSMDDQHLFSEIDSIEVRRKQVAITPRQTTESDPIMIVDDFDSVSSVDTMYSFDGDLTSKKADRCI
ncbi:expressed unknown protein [Seminavis robusta]|uniref:Uncharacterized protein n=1 Tax=Seminavis robusta TaxID=568900 RepID=A0A9N8E0S6_9STRA|nr:expressed unknown protein [Seminavis robusta]|eukprot:Sro533_g161620.1 n/a (198) ;mRNA; f:25660-26253